MHVWTAYLLLDSAAYGKLYCRRAHGSPGYINKLQHCLTYRDHFHGSISCFSAFSTLYLITTTDNAYRRAALCLSLLIEREIAASCDANTLWITKGIVTYVGGMFRRVITAFTQVSTSLSASFIALTSRRTPPLPNKISTTQLGNRHV